MVGKLKVLEQNRNNLLLAEAAAWLHDFRKCTDEHIERQALGNDPSRILYRRDYLQFVEPYQVTLLGESASFKELIRRRDKDSSWLVRTLAYCHDVAHVEKEDVFYHVQKQPEASTHSSSSFGYESQALRELSDRLNHIHFNKLGNLEQFEARSDFSKDLLDAFRNVPADTERPINEVTLWDWSSIVAALYKAAIAAALLGDKREPSDMRWSLLSVRLNGAAFLERVARIPDLLVRRKLIANGLDNVRQLLEECYPLGTEVYRDENGSVFIVPDIENLLEVEVEDGRKETLRDLIRDAFSAGTIYRRGRREKALKLDGEVVPSLGFDNCRWRREGSHGHQKPLPIADHVKEIPASHADPRRMRQWWQDYKEDICTVCQARPQGRGAPNDIAHIAHLARGEKFDASCQICKALERGVCVICEQRREDRSEEWGEKRDTTIWIDEIADVHGRIALVAGKFDLEHWLDGQSLFYPAEQTVLHVKNLGISLTDGQGFVIRGEDYDWSESRLALVSIGEVKAGSAPVQGQIFRVDPDRPSDRGRIRLIPASSGQQGCLEMERISKLRSMVETQTPARLHRVWETTRLFWQQVFEGFGEKECVGKVAVRLKISIESQKILVPSHTYELRIDNTNLSIVCTNQNEVVTADNLRRAALLAGASPEQYRNEKLAAEFVKELIEKKRSFDVEEPTGYGNPHKVLGRLRIIKVEVDTTPYTPAIEILSEPQTFIALVPADKALNAVNALKKKYVREMGKVRSRLPMTVGIVIAGRRTPLPAILDAGRRMLRQPVGSEEWAIEDVDKSQRPENITLKVRRGDQSLTLSFPTIMGDKKTEDVWYPYLLLEKSADHVEKPERLFKLDAGERSSYWVHVNDLQSGDMVSIMPSRFDFEFLDTASRRFEISYQDGKRRHTIHPARPYYLEQLDELIKLWETVDCGLATSQIHNLVGLIETKRMEWKELIEQDDPSKKTFEQTVYAIIANAGWESQPDRDCLVWLVRAAISGQLTDMVELYMGILDKDDNQQEGGNE